MIKSYKIHVLIIHFFGMITTVSLISCFDNPWKLWKLGYPIVWFRLIKEILRLESCEMFSVLTIKRLVVSYSSYMATSQWPIREVLELIHHLGTTKAIQTQWWHQNWSLPVSKPVTSRKSLTQLVKITSLTIIFALFIYISNEGLMINRYQYIIIYT